MSEAMRRRILLGLLTVLVSSLPVLAENEEEAEDDWKVYWKNGTRLESKDGDFKLKAGGEFQYDWTFILEDAGIEGLEDGTQFRRARLFVEGEIYQRFIFKAQYDFARGDAEIKDVFIGIKDIGPLGNVLLGHFKEPFSLDELTSSKYLSFLERSAPALAFAPSRNFGVMLFDAPLDERLTWAAGVFRDTDPFGNTSGGELNYTGRVSGLPIYRNGGRNLLHLGVAYSYRGVPEDRLRFRARPEIGLGPILGDTEPIPADSAVQLGLELALVRGPFYLHSEWYQADVDSPETGNPVFDGYFVQASCFLTGENKAYRKSRSAFDRVTPKRPIHRDWALGAWEIGVRYSALDLTDEQVHGGAFDTVNVSLNWYLNSFVRMMLSWLRAQSEPRPTPLDTASGEPPSPEAVLIRFQIDF